MFKINEELKGLILRTLMWTFTTSMVSIILSFITAYFEKPVNPGFQTVWDVLWWWINTVTGIGYVDTIPKTTLGKLFSAMVIASGLILFGIVVSQVTSLIKLTYEHKQRGIIRISYENHILIYGYTALTAGVVKLLKKYFPKVNIVLVSNEVQTNPFPGQVDFLFANPITKGTFREANTKYASAVIILANDRFNDPDAYSLVIASGIEKNNSTIVTLVEIVDLEMKSLFKDSKIDAFIDKKELLRDILEQKSYPKLIRIINKETDLDEQIIEDDVVDLM